MGSVPKIFLVWVLGKMVCSLLCPTRIALGHQMWTSLRIQTYFRLSLVSAKNNNVCEPKPGNDFCDVMAFVSPWPIRFHDRMKLAECSLQRIPGAVVLGLLELNCDWRKIPTPQKSFPGLGSQTLLFLAETSLRQPEIRLYSQASSHLVPECYSRRAQKWTHHFSKYSHQKYFGHRAHAWVQG